MLYYLFEFLETQYNLPGASLFDYLSFRAAVSVIISLIISVVFGKRIIEYLRKRQIGENVRKLGLEGEEEKSKEEERPETQDQSQSWLHPRSNPTGLAS